MPSSPIMAILRAPALLPLFIAIASAAIALHPDHRTIPSQADGLTPPCHQNQNTKANNLRALVALPRSDDDDHKSAGPSVPAIAGGVIGAILALAALFTFLLFLDRRRRMRQQSAQRVSEEHMKCVSEIFGFPTESAAAATSTRGPHSRNVSETYSIYDEKLFHITRSTQRDDRIG